MLRRVWRPRVLIYGALAAGHEPGLRGQPVAAQRFVVDVIKDRGALARVVGTGRVENVYRCRS